MAINIFKNLFGDKSTKDRKEYQPSIDKANEFQAQFKNLTDNELRAKTTSFKTLIAEKTNTLESELKDLKAKAADLNTPIHEKETVFEAIDKMTKKIDDKIEEVKVTVSDIWSIMKLRKNLIGLCVILIGNNFNFYVLTFYLKYFPGNLFANTIIFSLADLVGVIISGAIVKITSLRTNIVCGGAIGIVGACLYLFVKLE